MRLADTGQIEEMLGDLAFPASKEQIVHHAHGKKPESDAERALLALPLATYDSLAEVMRSVPVEPGPDRTGSEQDHQRRRHEKAGLAEHMRHAEGNPVEDELRRDDDEGLA